jgi:hypothetical protein
MGMLLRFYGLIPFRRSISSCLDNTGGKAAPPVNAPVQTKVPALAIHNGDIIEELRVADFRLRYLEASQHRVITDDMIFHIIDQSACHIEVLFKLRTPRSSVA